MGCVWGMGRGRMAPTNALQDKAHHAPHRPSQRRIHTTPPVAPIQMDISSVPHAMDKIHTNGAPRETQPTHATRWLVLACFATPPRNAGAASTLAMVGGASWPLCEPPTHAKKEPERPSPEHNSQRLHGVRRLLVARGTGTRRSAASGTPLLLGGDSSGVCLCMACVQRWTR